MGRWGRGDAGTRGRGDAGMRGRGDAKMGRQGDKENNSSVNSHQSTLPIAN
nr:hypothetical protein [Nostoc sp. CreGUA01]